MNTQNKTAKQYNQKVIEKQLNINKPVSQVDKTNQQQLKTYSKTRISSSLNGQKILQKNTTKKTDVKIAKDNLTSNKHFQGHSEYQNQFTKFKGKQQLIKDTQQNDKLKKINHQNNIKDHLGRTLGQGNRIKLEHKTSLRYKKEQPKNIAKPSNKIIKNNRLGEQAKNFTKPSQKITGNNRQTEKTPFQQNIIDKKSNQFRNTKDNIVIGQSGIRYNNKTVHQKTQVVKQLQNKAQQQYPVNKKISNIVKQENQMTYALQPKSKINTKTEYERKFTPKNVEVKKAPLRKQVLNKKDGQKTSKQNTNQN